MRFLCDEMLGSLARDLRILGYDVALARGGGDAAILATALREGRVLLTRDVALATRARTDALLVHATHRDDQLAEVLDGLALAPAARDFLTRCTRCGGMLRPVPAARAPAPAPPRARRVHECLLCGHVYWAGSHVPHIRARLGPHVSGGEVIKQGARVAGPMGQPRIRSLTLKDVEGILDIDATVTGTPVKSSDNDLWRLIAETTTCFGAEADGRLIGFVLADIRPWEFGQRAHVGWIIALGVRPDAQGHGIGRLLGERVLEQFQRLGVHRIQTLVGPGTKGLEGYFQALGFEEAPVRVLARDLREEEPVS